MADKNQLQPNKMQDRIVQLVVFRLGDEEFGIPIEQINEIIRAKAITFVPGSPDFIDGVANVEGNIAVIINLKKRFSLCVKKNETAKHIIMIKQDRDLFGLLVDEVVEVLKVPAANIHDVPELVSQIDQTYISGVLSLGNRLIIIVDLNEVLTEEDLIKMSKHTADVLITGESDD